MKMTNREIVDRINGLNAIISRAGKYPVVFSFAISKNLRALEAAYRDYEEGLKKLLGEHGEKDASGKVIGAENGKFRIREGSREEWAAGLEELLKIEVDVPVQMVPEDVFQDEQVEADVPYVCSFMLE